MVLTSHEARTRVFGKLARDSFFAKSLRIVLMSGFIWQLSSRRPSMTQLYSFRCVESRQRKCPIRSPNKSTCSHFEASGKPFFRCWMNGADCRCELYPSEHSKHLFGRANAARVECRFTPTWWKRLQCCLVRSIPSPVINGHAGRRGENQNPPKGNPP